ncbi:MAG: DUF4012 domain-containing protein [Patescibacteria group bacterium]|nr:DUF4012 domain-containing protein [Patescibacteria group bacterium]
MRKRVLPQLFDVRPTVTSGEIDYARIERAQVAVVDLRGRRKILWDAVVTPPQRASATPTSSVPARPVSRERGSKDVAPAGKGLAIIQAAIPRESLRTRRDTVPPKEGLLTEIETIAMSDAVRLAALRLAQEPEALRSAGEVQDPAPGARGVSHAEAAGLSRVVTVSTPVPSAAPRRPAPSAPRAPRPRPVSVPPAPLGDFSGQDEVATPAPVAQIVSTPVNVPEPKAGRVSPAVAQPRPRAVLAEIATRSPVSSSNPDPALDVAPQKKQRSARALFMAGAGVLGAVVLISALGFFSAKKEHLTASGGTVLRELEQGLTHLKEKQWHKAQDHFRKSAQMVATLTGEIGGSGTAQLVLAQQDGALQSSESFLRIGKSASDLGLLLARVGEEITQGETFQHILAKDGRRDPLKDLRTVERELGEAQQLLEGLKKEVTAVVVEDLPEEYREKFFHFVDELPALEGMIGEGVTLLPVVRKFLGGDNKPKKYLLLLENSSELRPSGGFPGTYGIAEFEGGRLKNFFLDGIYNPDGQLKIEVAPPKALSRVSPLWAMRDAGWFFDFPTSAKKFAWFYEREGGTPVDGVIAITPRFVERLLGIVGSFSMSAYGQERIDKDNFIEVLQFEVEADYDRALNKPKKILSDLAPELLERLAQLDSRGLERVLDAALISLQEKDIQLFFFDPKLQREVEERSWAGRIADTAGSDYLAVVHANVAGGKADWVTEDKILQEVTVNADGTLIKTVSITRTHNGGDTPYPWWNAPNKDYLRVLVPKGSTLLAATGFTERDTFSRTPKKKSVTIDPDLLLMEGTLAHDATRALDTFREHDKEAFAGWMIIPPGEERTVTVRYLLPQRLDARGVLEIVTQKQAGTKPAALTTRVLFPDSWDVTGYPAEAAIRRGTLEIRQPLSQDLAHSLQFVRK